MLDKYKLLNMSSSENKDIIIIIIIVRFSCVRHPVGIRYVSVDVRST